MTIYQFMAKIKAKDVEGNRTYLYCTVKGCKYGQSYQNAVMTREDMINSFALFYYKFL